MGKNVPMRHSVPEKKFLDGYLSVPISGGIAAGPEINSACAPDEEYVDIPPTLAQGHTPDDFLVVIAKGCSMEPNIMDGDRLVFLRDTELHGGRRVHAISFNDYEYTAKLVKRDDEGNIIITAYNTSVWEPRLLTPQKAQEQNFKIHGYLIHLSRIKDF